MPKSTTVSKTLPSPLYVHVWTIQGFLLAGELWCDNTFDGHFWSRFRYDLSYVTHHDAFALDPLNLRLNVGDRATTSRYVGLGVLFDAALLIERFDRHYALAGKETNRTHYLSAA